MKEIRDLMNAIPRVELTFDDADPLTDRWQKHYTKQEETCWPLLMVMSLAIILFSVFLFISPVQTVFCSAIFAAVLSIMFGTYELFSHAEDPKSNSLKTSFSLIGLGLVLIFLAAMILTGASQ